MYIYIPYWAHKHVKCYPTMTKIITNKLGPETARLAFDRGSSLGEDAFLRPLALLSLLLSGRRRIRASGVGIALV